MATDFKVFGEKLSILRIEKKISLKDIADAVGVSATAISSYEKSEKLPSIETAYKISRFFNVSLDELCGVNTDSSKNEYTTYSDIIRKIIELDNLVEITVYDSANVYAQGNNIYINDCVFHIENEFTSNQIQDFLTGWQKMKALLHEKSIDKELYELWIEKQLKSTNILVERIIDLI